MYPPEKMIFKVDYALKLSKYTSQNSFIGLKFVYNTTISVNSTTIHCRALPLIAFSDQEWIRYNLRADYFQLWFYTAGKHKGIIQKNNSET